MEYDSRWDMVYAAGASNTLTWLKTPTTELEIFGFATITAIATSTSITAYSTVVTPFSSLRLSAFNILVHLLCVLIFFQLARNPLEHALAGLVR